MQKMKSKKKTKSSSNTTRVSEFKYIPSELCTQILANLPAKTLVRFRCVCKSWCSIIDDPDFATLHRKLCKINSANSKLLLFLEGTGRFGEKGCLLTVRHADAFKKTEQILKSSKRYYLIGSCNELVFIRDYFDPAQREQLMLWNPCIRKAFRIPLPPLPSFDHIVYTFGFAPSSNDYKVVAMSLQRCVRTHVRNVCFAVYTLSNRQWSLKNNDGLNMSQSYFERVFWEYGYSYPEKGFIFQGAAYWISGDPNGNGYPAARSTHLVSLDFDSEKFTYLELSFTSDDKGAVRFPFRLRESLAVFCISSVEYSIWALEEDSGKRVWTRRFSGVSSCDGFNLFSSSWRRLPLFFYESGNGGCFVYGKTLYNIATGQVHELRTPRSHYVDIEMYKEGLIGVVRRVRS